MAWDKKRTAAEQKQIKKQLIEMLQKMPLVQSACAKVGIGRSTLYRWKKEDASFAKELEAAQQISRAIMNDIAESKMIQRIEEGNPNMIRFWLTHNHPIYQKQTSDVSVEWKPPSATMLGFEYFNALKMTLPSLLHTDTPSTEDDA